MQIVSAFHPYFRDSMWCPVCSCWPAHPSACGHTLSRGVRRRSAAAKDNSGPPRALGPPRPRTCRHVCVESTRPRRYVVLTHIPSPLLMNHTTAHPHPHHQQPKPPQTCSRSPARRSAGGRTREGVLYFAPVFMFVSLIHRGRSGGEKKNKKKKQSPHWTQDFSSTLPLVSGFHFLCKHNQGRFIS